MEPRRHRSPLDLEPGRFRALGHELVDALASHLETLPGRPVAPDREPAQLKPLLPQELPDEGTDAGELLRETVPLLLDHSLFNGHPRFFGYITSSPAPIGALGDLLAAVVNPNVGGWELSPIATEIEVQTVSWIAELLGLAPGTGGLLVSGGNVANFVGYLAARRTRPGDVVYASVETHTWIQKAVELFGGELRSIPVDGARRVSLTALREEIARDRRAGREPLLLVANAGTVSTGAIDPIPELAAIAREEEMWLHVDGAYGGFAAMLPDAPEPLGALGLADSVAVDPHKWLYVPLEAGCALVREPEALREAFSHMPSYYRFEGGRTNFHELGLQNSRGFRALKVWLALRQAGRSGYRKMLAEDVALARALYRAVEREPSLEAFSQSLSITTFRYAPPNLTDEVELNRLNEALLARLKRSGEVFLSNAVVDGTFLLRACVVNFRTSLEDVEAIPEIVVRHGDAIPRQRPTPAVALRG